MAASRPTLGASVVPALDRLLISGFDNWLLLANTAYALVLLGSIAPPFLLKADLRWAADATHTLFLLLFPQRPEHSYFRFGHKLAMEQRMLAMFGARLIGGLALWGSARAGVEWPRLAPVHARACAGRLGYPQSVVWIPCLRLADPHLDGRLVQSCTCRMAVSPAGSCTPNPGL